jgi:hypothetical protein
MRAASTRVLVAFTLLVLAPAGVVAQTASSDQAPVGTAARSVLQLQRWFQLDEPFSQRLQFRFDGRPIPGYESLQLPTYQASAPLLQQGGLGILLTERVVPALELDCLKGPCTPVLERSIGLEARLSLGTFTPRVPESHLFVGTEFLRMPKGFSRRTMVGLAGLLDF